jgi:acyl-CoA reductase-like NAD-dependent aldehyde dehydrogenase
MEIRDRRPDTDSGQVSRGLTQLDGIPPSGRNGIAEVLATAHAAADFIEEHRLGILAELTRHESHEAAEDEIGRSVEALRHLHREHANLGAAVDSISVFLPINLPLYSLMLFAAIPSLLAKDVAVRSPAATPQWVQRVATVSGLSRFFPGIRLLTVTRREFIQSHATSADVVIFTGRYENAELVREACKSSLFIYEGSGPNPIVVGPDANLRRDIQRILSPRLFNGGQDCAGPDAYLVHSSVLPEFTKAVQDVLSELRTGSYRDPAVRVGEILNRSPLPDLEQRLQQLAPHTIVGGRVRRDSGFVEPTLVCRPILEHDRLYEFFAPVFYVLEYAHVAELEHFFESSEYNDHAMYAAFFGQPPPAAAYKSSVVLKEQTVLEVERGNDPYGGFGVKANYVSYNGQLIETGPILISGAIARFASRPPEQSASHA